MPNHSREFWPVNVTVSEGDGIERNLSPVKVAVPLPNGVLRDAAQVAVQDAMGNYVESQLEVSNNWPDGSVRWLLVHFLLTCAPNTEHTYKIVNESSHQPVARKRSPASGHSSRVTYGCAGAGSSVFSSITVGKFEMLCGGAEIVLTEDSSKRCHVAEFNAKEEVASGPIFSKTKLCGSFPTLERKRPVRIEVICTSFRASGIASLSVKLHNSDAAVHVGNQWDLGDRGSLVFKDLTLRLPLANSFDRLGWSNNPDAPLASADSENWKVYQDSSGGEHWNSSNHVTSSGVVSTSFRGFEIRSGDAEEVVGKGDRCQPVVVVGSSDYQLAVSIENFWQTFPNAIRWNKGRLDLSVFPEECAAPYELQGGEQKRHTLLMHTGKAEELTNLGSYLYPIPGLCESRVLEPVSTGSFSRPVSSSEELLADYIASIVDGSRSFVSLREIPDEYGWRNFGDLYADHEAVRAEGPDPLVSHYNNQYDFLFAAAMHYLRSGDQRWWRLLSEGAPHVVDIDIYHTEGDRAAYNGGLFWHTDHYQDAGTATHRSYSAKHQNLESGGGGPSNEHNYTSGLLYHYLLSGDDDSRAAVISLANWVLAMDDGEQSLFALASEAPTGLASNTVRPDYHGPGRGAGNSINALLDAYQLTTDYCYLAKAEALIQRCIHPQDDIESLTLDQPEHRWSYLVFLQILGKYLKCKSELRQFDYGFYYGRDSLSRYADWMRRCERPYKEWLDRVDIPSETWPAQDIRKSHVLLLAATYRQEPEKAAMVERAQWFFDRCIEDLHSFETAHLTRPRVLLAVYGHLCQDLLQSSRIAALDGPEAGNHSYTFGSPRHFSSQRDGLLRSLKSRGTVSAIELGRLLSDRIRKFLRRLPFGRTN